MKVHKMLLNWECGLLHILPWHKSHAFWHTRVGPLLSYRS